MSVWFLRTRFPTMMNLQELLKIYVVRGLIRIKTNSDYAHLIVKRDEFYHDASRLTYDVWLKQYDHNLEKEREKIEHDATISKYKARAVKYWYISIIALILSLGSLLWSIFDEIIMDYFNK